MMRKSPNRPINIESRNPALIVSATADVLDTPERILDYCQKKGYINGNQTDIRALIEGDEKLILSFEDLDGYDAYIQKMDDGRYKIAVNRKHPETRQRFSMAHEYIHYQMHRDHIERMPIGERILHRDEQRNSIEYQANRYAAEILMPEETFFAVMHECNGDIAAMAAALGVSVAALRYRADALGVSENATG